ncbi:hypothetical protein DFH06DRAFT_496909 [Mycena polygramma]|nr:hypothetical protein DFH06DRAFT_496909 [Mycena polygramma]
MTDYHGKDWPLRVTKYWDDDQEEVVYSAKLREEPIQLREILGYYEWVFNACEEEDREVKPGSDSHGSLTLEVDKTKIEPSKGKPGEVEDVDPADVKGEWDTCDISSSFIGLSDGYSEASWTFDHENLVEKPEGERNDDEDFSESQFMISVVDVIDDNGHPFIQFTHSSGMHESEVTYIGKKQGKRPNSLNREVPLEGLTNGERQRLGMFVTEEEIERAALELKKASGSVEADGTDDEDKSEEKDTGADSEVNPRKRRAEDGLLNDEEPPCKK